MLAAGRAQPNVAPIEKGTTGAGEIATARAVAAGGGVLVRGSVKKRAGAGWVSAAYSHVDIIVLNAKREITQTQTTTFSPPDVPATMRGIEGRSHYSAIIQRPERDSVIRIVFHNVPRRECRFYQAASLGAGASHASFVSPPFAFSEVSSSFMKNPADTHDHSGHAHGPAHKEQHDDHGEGHRHAHRPADTILNPGASAECETTLTIAGMDCAEEVAAIQRALKPLPGVREVRTNLIAGKATISHDASITPESLIEAIGAEGLTATVATGDSGAVNETAQRARLVSVLISGFCTGFGLLLRWSLRDDLIAIPLFAAAIVSGGWFILPKAIRAMRRFALDMNVLMTVAIAGAAAIGEWQEGAAVAFLFALSELLESFSVARARKALSSLVKLSPPVALLKEGESFREAPVEQVRPGDVIAIKSGSRVPLDGEIIEGESAVDQAPITGESVPVEKRKGDLVFAGTINGAGSLEVRVTKLSSDTTLAKIIHLVEEAQAQKAPSQRFVDVFAKYYTPAVMVLALLVLLVPPLLFHEAWFTWIYRALVLLVIACPCALVISTPVSIVSGLTAMARRGVLIKGGVFLEAIGKLRALALDKTGTITEGKPRVTRVHALGATPENEVVAIAAAIDMHSDHPLAQAVVTYAQEEKIEFVRSENYKARTVGAAPRPASAVMITFSETIVSRTSWRFARRKSSASSRRLKAKRSRSSWSAICHIRAAKVKSSAFLPWATPSAQMPESLSPRYTGQACAGSSC